MEIRNAKIENVTINFFGPDKLAARLEFVFNKGSQTYGFNMQKIKDVQTFMKLREFVEAENLEEMNGKIVRLVYFNKRFKGFGHVIEDKFIFLGHEKDKEVKEINESELITKCEQACGIVGPKEK